MGDILELHARCVTEEDAATTWRWWCPSPRASSRSTPRWRTPARTRSPRRRTRSPPAYVQRLDNEVRYYFLKMPRGTHTFHFRVRAATEGSFVHPAP